MIRQVRFQVVDAQTKRVIAETSVVLRDDVTCVGDLLDEVLAQRTAVLPRGVNVKSLDIVVDGLCLRPCTRLDEVDLVEPITLATTKVWFQVNEAQTQSVLAQGSVFLGSLESTVADLQAAVLDDAASDLPPGVKPSHLVIVVDGTPLELWTRLDCVDLKKPVMMEVAVNPRKRKISDRWPLGPLKRLDVADAECQLDQLFQERQEGHAVVNTPGLHAFWKGFGGFPSSYFVRKEEVMVWRVVTKNFSTLDEISTVVVGSPGVGKSCFLVLVGMYFACVLKQRVLIIRCVAPNTSRNAVVYFDGQGSYGRAKDVAAADLLALRKSVEGAIVLVDGLTELGQQAIDRGLAPWHILATSCQYRIADDDASQVVLLPAWQFEDLVQYARATDWVVSSGLRPTKDLVDSAWPKIVKQQYFYSGGSLRAFCKSRTDVISAVERTRIDNVQAYKLAVDVWSPNDVSFRRHYAADRNTEAEFTRYSMWKEVVDSAYAMQVLGQLGASFEQQLLVFKHAQVAGAGFVATAYKELFHCAVRDSRGKNSPVVLKVHSQSHYDRIEIHAEKVQWCGQEEAECLDAVANLSEGTYWRPIDPFFPLTDAVTTCAAYPRGSATPEVVVAYIQVTTRCQKTFKPDRLAKMNQAMDQNQCLGAAKRVFVVVGPDPEVCEAFQLKAAPTVEAFPTMVGCFNPYESDDAKKALAKLYLLDNY